MSEAALLTATKKYLKTLSPAVRVIRKDQGPHSEKGVSDLLLCAWGKFVAIELKAGNNRPTKLQSKFLHEINEAGGIIGCCWTLEDVKQVIERVRG